MSSTRIRFSRASPVVGVSLVLILGCAGAVRTPGTETLRAGVTGSEYQKVFDQYRESIPATMKQKKIPGLSIAVVDREGVLWAAGFGRTGKGRQE